MSIGELLTADFPGAASKKLKASAPVAPMPMMLTLDQLKAYDGNPRQMPNECREELKASIRERGLDVMLHVTQRPGEEHYIIESGGNTRLSILKELWEETGDERFYRIQVMFRPWKGELHVLTAHIVENELRAGMCFWDKAQAMVRVKALMESDKGEIMSWSEFGRRLSGIGLPQAHAQLARMRFLVEKLADVLPDDMRTQIGPHHVQLFQSAIARASKLAGRDILDSERDSLRQVIGQADDVRAAIDAIERMWSEGETEQLADVSANEDPEVAVSQPPEQAEALGRDHLHHKGASEVQARRGSEEPSVDDPTISALLQGILDARSYAYALACKVLSPEDVAPADIGYGFDVVGMSESINSFVGALGDPGASSDLSLMFSLDRRRFDGLVALVRECWMIEESLRELKDRSVIHPDVDSVSLSNRDLLNLLDEQDPDAKEERNILEACVRAGATNAMILSLFEGCSWEKLNRLRGELGVETPGGRPVKPLPFEKEKILEQWESCAPSNALDTARACLDISQSLEIPLATVWNTIQNFMFVEKPGT